MDIFAVFSKLSLCVLGSYSHICNARFLLRGSVLSVIPVLKVSTGISPFSRNAMAAVMFVFADEARRGRARQGAAARRIGRLW